MNRLLTDNVNITTLLGKYLLPDGTPGTIPLIKGGILAESETDLPCITYNAEQGDKNKANKNQRFLLNVYAGNTINMLDAELNSYTVAATIQDQLDGFHGFAGNVPVSVTASILGAVPDPAANQVNTPVEVRLNKIGGA